MWFTRGGAKPRAHASFGTLVLAWVMVSWLAGCASDDQDPTDESDGSADAGPRPIAVACPKDIPDMRIGMQAQGVSGLARGELVDADHVPVKQYFNAWTVAFTGPDGEPMDDVELTRAQTFMPAHNHDGRHEPVIGDRDAMGNYLVEELNLWMEGPWEVRFFVDTPDGEDTVIFRVCLLEQRAEDESD